MQTRHLIIPEIVILDAYKKALAFIRNDYLYHKKRKTLHHSYLYLTLGDLNALQRYDLLKQAETVFIIKDDNPRYLDINIFFNSQRAHIPTIHITNPAENPKNNDIGIGEGFQKTIYEKDGDGDERSRVVFNRRFVEKYSIVITSDNTNEVVMIYQVIRAMTISLMEHLMLSGLENIKISGQEISLKSDLIPQGIFIKAIGLEFELDVPAIQLSTHELGLKFYLQGNVVDEEKNIYPLSTDEISESFSESYR